MTKRVTQKDIAKALNIGYITVQRALNGTGYVSKELKNKIFAYAEEVGYRPHKAAQALVRNRVTRIALFSMTTPEHFWDEVQRGVELAQSQLADYNYVINFYRIPPLNTSLFLNKLKKEENNNVDAIAIVYSHQFEIEKVMDWVKLSGIPFMTFLADTPDDDRLCYVGPDYEGEGSLAADFLGHMLKNNGFIGILTFGFEGSNMDGGDIAVIGRQRGFLNRLKTNFPNINYGIQYLPGHEHPEIAEKTIESFLFSQKELLDGLYFIDSAHRPLIRALKKVKINRTFPIITYDLYLEMEEYIKSGYITATIFQNPIFQSYYTIMVLRKYLETGKLPEKDKIFIPYSLIMSSNADVYRNQVLTSILDINI